MDLLLFPLALAHTWQSALLGLSHLLSLQGQPGPRTSNLSYCYIFVWWTISSLPQFVKRDRIESHRPFA